MDTPKLKLEEIIKYHTDGMVDANIKVSRATSLVIRTIAELKKTYAEKDITDYLDVLKSSPFREAFQEARKLPIHKDVQRICTELVRADSQNLTI